MILESIPLNRRLLKWTAWLAVSIAMAFLTQRVTFGTLPDAIMSKYSSAATTHRLVTLASPHILFFSTIIFYTFKDDATTSGFVPFVLSGVTNRATVFSTLCFLMIVLGVISMIFQTLYIETVIKG